MSMVTWNDDFLIGVAEIDKHHRRLVELLNLTHDEVAAGAPSETVGLVLDKLIDYATYHFIAEERLMEATGYPGFAEHREEHERFTRRVVQIQTDFYRDRTDIPAEVLLFLKNWLTHHILKVDAQLGSFLASQKIVRE